MRSAALSRVATEPAVCAAPREADDPELMRRIAAGHLTALGILYDRYHQDVRRFVSAATRSSNDVEDIVHDAFLGAVRAAPEYDGRACARPFLIAIAARLVRQRRERFGRWGRALCHLGELLWERSNPTPEKVASDVQQLAAARASFQRLSPEKRMVLLLVEDGLSGEEIAATLGIPVATVWTRVHYARAEMRRAIEKGERR
jgi:RNA polymerase sigma-70 factor (ECF subfamily)